MVLKFAGFFSILQYLDRGIQLLCLACFVCGFRGFHIQKENWKITDGQNQTKETPKHEAGICWNNSNKATLFYIIQY